MERCPGRPEQREDRQEKVRTMTDKTCGRTGKSMMREAAENNGHGEDFSGKVIGKAEDMLKDHMAVYPEAPMKETAAVLVPVIRKADGPALLYERRASTLSAQPGEICFPGGRLEKGETPVQAAVRETCEELLVREDQIRILGQMNGVTGPAGAPVWPVVAELSGYGGDFSTDEVGEILTVPVSWLMQNPPKIYNTYLETVPAPDFPYELIPGGRNYPWRRKIHRVWFYQFHDTVLWGLTAHITDSFIRLLEADG